jgi:hypothetical protein
VAPLTKLLATLPLDRASRLTGLCVPLIDHFPTTDAAARIIAYLAKPAFRPGFTGPYMEKALRKTFVDSLAELARPPLAEAVAGDHPRKDFLADCLARIEKKAQKKKPAKRTT